VDHGAPGMMRAVLVGDDPAVDEAGQRDRREQPVDAPAPLAQGEQAPLAGGRGEHFEAGDFQELDEDFPGGFILVDDEHTGGVRSGTFIVLAQQRRVFLRIGTRMRASRLTVS
jgi:hypothetical protein